LSALPAIAVIDFDSGDYCTARKAAIMTDLFRSELIRSGRAGIVERKHLNRIVVELQFQMSDWADPAKIKRAGRMLGADYLMTGSFDMLGSNLYLVVQMLDIETARAVHSSRLVLAAWEEYDWKVRDLAEDFINNIPAENIFTGAWTGDILHDDLIDSYTLTFTGPNRCTVRVASLLALGEVTEEAQGTYSYDGNILKISAVFRNSRIPHLKSIQWASVISTGEDSRSFAMLAKPASGSTTQVRVIFTKE
jgi:TolB-like protein